MPSGRQRAMSATNRGSTRIINDAYNTPTWLVEAIIPYVIRYLDTECWDGISRENYKILEPACGELVISNTVERLYPSIKVINSDIIEPYNTDFLKPSHLDNQKYHCIITNPPYSLAMEFIERAFELLEPNGLVCFLLRLNFLGSKKRANWLRSNVPRIHVTPRRPKFKVNKEGKWGTDATEYAWFFWSPAGLEPNIVILDTEK